MKGLPYDCASTTNAAQSGKITVLSATICRIISAKWPRIEIADRTIPDRDAIFAAVISGRATAFPVRWRLMASRIATCEAR